NTGIRVSEVGFGGWQLGNEREFVQMTNEEAVRLVHAALDRGCNLFDTAPNYGLGASERILGQALQGRRAEAVITSKFGPHVDGDTDFNASLLLESVEGSLKRLQTDYLDVLLLHNPPLEVLHGTTAHWEILRTLKQQGKVRAFGASLDWSKEV